MIHEAANPSVLRIPADNRSVTRADHREDRAGQRALVPGRRGISDEARPTQTLPRYSITPPGINDPFTAIRCLDWLASGISRRLERGRPRSTARDDEGQIRVVLRPVHFSEMLKSSFEQIEEFGRRSAVVTAHILRVLRLVAHNTRTEEDREVILKHAQQVLDASQESLVLEQDRKTVERLYGELIDALERGN
jgi:uncharacterized membrane protein